MAYSNTLISKIACLEKNAFSDAWSEDALADALKKDYNALYLAFDNQGEVVVEQIFCGMDTMGQLEKYALDIIHGQTEFIGYLISNFICDESELLRVAVDFNYRNMHVGALLMERYLTSKRDYIKNYYLEVRENNKPARHLYEKYGYQVIGIRKNYYKNPTENAVIYSITSN